MPSVPLRLAAIFGIVSLAVVMFAASPGELRMLRAGSMEDGSLVFASDLPLIVASAIHRLSGLGSLPALMTVSIAGWALGAAVLSALPRTRKDAVLMLHPASVLMVTSGAGFGAFGLVALFAAIRHAASGRAMVDLPVLGLAMGLAALTVPEFERLILPLASVLFLTAPPVMLERQIFSYYLIVFLPALTILGLAAGLGRDLLARATPDLSGPNLAIAVIAVPSLLWAAGSRKTRRLALVLFILFAAMSLAGREGLDWPVLAAAIAGASAIRGRFGLIPEVIGAVATVLVAGFLTMGLTGPGSPS
ncbi:MAG: hypothetical protein AAGA39_02695 [Pseudomonadota bacterium]